MITIDNARWHRATLHDGDNGVIIIVYRKLGNGNAPWTEIHREIIDAPFHLVCDYMYWEIHQMHNDHINPIPASLDKRVRSINGIPKT